MPSGNWGNRDKNERLDKAVWDIVCDSFKCDIPFTIFEAVNAVRAIHPSFRQMTEDLAVGRVMGALMRMADKTPDIRAHVEIDFTLPSIPSD